MLAVSVYSFITGEKGIDSFVLLILRSAGVILYFAFFESSAMQATPGKKAMGIVVIDLDGKRISFWRAFIRNCGKIISGLILYIGYIMAGFTKKKQALHDMMAGCLVVVNQQDRQNKESQLCGKSIRKPLTAMWLIAPCLILFCLIFGAFYGKIFNSPGVQAQAHGIEWETLNDEAKSLYRQGQYDRAIVVAKKALEVAEQTGRPQSSRCGHKPEQPRGAIPDPRPVRARPSRSTSVRWQSERRPSARIIPMWPRA